MKPPPPPPLLPCGSMAEKTIGESLFDTKCLAALSEQTNQTGLSTLIRQYVESAGTMLNDVNLPYESRPTEERRVSVKDSKDVVLVAHCATDGVENKVTVSSGFVLNAKLRGNAEESLVLTCAHTLEEIRQSTILTRQQTGTTTNANGWLGGTFIVTANGLYPVKGVVSSLPRSDLVLLSCKLPAGSAKALPVSPYPAPSQSRIRAHLVAHQKSSSEAEWGAWLGGTWGRWADGKVVGYRDFGGREAYPGTYDGLSHMYFMPEPTRGSSGGPIVDEMSGAVVGVVLGVEQGKGWGVPAETIFEMFALPGLASTPS